MALQMKERASKPNHLKQMYDSGKLTIREGGWITSLDDVVPEFPELSLSDIRSITLGVYQIKQARYYVDEHMMANGDYKVNYIH